ncbi:hypothetical protein U5922_003945 [Aquicoccus sp. G2-2]|uniref:hypothetical protein n=1 Tax=Aquicoccus sp. G2-2 TaxID=3092120 RepID=UPI002ADFE1EC|nr:hypothetical protein [Aquicoccus sp. G2-2]MEA1112664.1 hypothetical protein [Aquicoccus sp. G2-2]
MTEQPEIKTLPDGSIDYAYYIARSHDIRSADAQAALATLGRLLRAAWAALTGWTGRRARRPEGGAPAR